MFETGTLEYDAFSEDLPQNGDLSRHHQKDRRIQNSNSPQWHLLDERCLGHHLPPERVIHSIQAVVYLVALLHLLVVNLLVNLVVDLVVNLVDLLLFVNRLATQMVWPVVLVQQSSLVRSENQIKKTNHCTHTHTTQMLFLHALAEVFLRTRQL
jgi:hypothetical protein